jgi:hypothetical protein
MQTQRLRCRKSNDPLALRAMHERVYGGDAPSTSTLKRQKRVADPDDAKKKRKVQGRGAKVK